MKNIIISDYQYESRIQKMAEVFGEEATEDCGEYSFKFDNSFGTGVIRGINFEHGVGIMMFSMKLKREIKLQYKLGRRHPIQHIYCSQGKISLVALGSDVVHDLVKHEAMIYAPRGDENYQVLLQTGIEIKFVLVSVVRFLYLRKIECDIDTIPKTLQEMFKDTVGRKSFYFKSTSEPIISNTLLQLFKSDQKGLERKLLIEANCIKLITTLIKRYRVESNYNGSLYRFSKQDIAKINQAKNHLIDNLESTPTVKELSRMINMNANKLQKGFHMLFGKSIRQFTISMKMHYALHLLDEEYHSISEISYQIGYTNKGHFSQLFKKEFGLLPSEYSKRVPFKQEV